MKLHYELSCTPSSGKGNTLFYLECRLFLSEKDEIYLNKYGVFNLLHVIHEFNERLYVNISPEELLRGYKFSCANPYFTKGLLSVIIERIESVRKWVQAAESFLDAGFFELEITSGE